VTAEWRSASHASVGTPVTPGQVLKPHGGLYFRAFLNDGTTIPPEDAVDVGITYALGVDVKSYFCPMTLAERLSRSIGGLAQFDRRIIAVPDARTRSHLGYLRDLAANYRGKTPVEFMTVSGAIEALTR
jgi:hypothetical protein